ncbi:hypothetical protein Q75_04040 [Bacillus coahuilensis p1.1.43]|uniref:YhzD-like protein n=1 Tax=Bacillus coahuilensis p1.1.43 TaxID=1150625 RepID=A0A147KB14_9BACI|nr:YhzD family protein [Bacillus coahuilensis]KUP07936.1 hypothetical protein Q75_04040 [Bacillus coahuilensis p1.1.43]
MREYKLTVFEKTGEKVVEENILAENDQVAKEKGKTFIEEQGYSEKTHRFTSPEGKLLLFHV